MHSWLAFAFAVCASTLVSCAPTALLEPATLWKNGQAAQALNAEWKNLTAADPCTDSERACVENTIAVCQNKKWDIATGRCSQNQKCFALPNIKAEGTMISCTSEKNALSLINSTGAKGDTSGAGSSEAISASRSHTSGPAATSASASAMDVAQVTVTVTITQVTTPLPLTIRTISPADASKMISSMLANQTPAPTLIPPPSSEASAPPAAASQRVRTLSPEDAAKDLSSILGLGKPTASSTMCEPSVAASDVAASQTPAKTITLAAAQPTGTDAPTDGPATATPGVTTSTADSSSGY